MNTKALFLCGLSSLVVLPATALADKYTVALTTTDNRPFASINATAPPPPVGPPFQFSTTMLVDSGAGFGFVFDPGSTFAKYLTGGVAGKARGIGGEVNTMTGASVPAVMQGTVGFNPAPTVPGGQVSKQPTIPNSYSTLPLPRAGQGTIGAEYLNTFASYAFNNKAGKPVSMVLNTADTVGQGRPAKTDSAAVAYVAPNMFPDGAVDYNSGVFALSLQVSASGGPATTASFIVDSGAASSLITSSLATELGMSPSGTGTYSTDLGSFSATVGSASFKLFPNDSSIPGLTSGSVAIANSSNDPDGVNILGSDILSQLGYWEVDPGSQMFYASMQPAATPEPTGVAAFGVGILGIFARCRRSRRK